MQVKASVAEAGRGRFCSKSCFDQNHPHLTDEGRFWSHVAFGEVDECWPWTGTRKKAGYGRFRFRTANSTIAASRAAYWLTVGDPGELWVLHTCDNPPCCNPLHLYLGTNTENVQDKVARGRLYGGARHHSTKFSDQQVEELHALRDAGWTITALAQRYGVRRFAVQKRLIRK